MARRLDLGRRLGRSAVRRIAAGHSRTIVVRLDRGDRRRLRRAIRAAGLRRLRATVMTEVRSGEGMHRLRDRVVLRR